MKNYHIILSIATVVLLLSSCNSISNSSSTSIQSSSIPALEQELLYDITNGYQSDPYDFSNRSIPSENFNMTRSEITSIISTLFEQQNMLNYIPTRGDVSGFDNVKTINYNGDTYYALTTETANLWENATGTALVGTAKADIEKIATNTYLDIENYPATIEFLAHFIEKNGELYFLPRNKAYTTYKGSTYLYNTAGFLIVPQINMDSIVITEASPYLVKFTVNSFDTPVNLQIMLNQNDNWVFDDSIIKAFDGEVDTSADKILTNKEAVYVGMDLLERAEELPLHITPDFWENATDAETIIIDDIEYIQITDELQSMLGDSDYSIFWCDSITEIEALLLNSFDTLNSSEYTKSLLALFIEKDGKLYCTKTGIPISSPPIVGSSITPTSIDENSIVFEISHMLDVVLQFEIIKNNSNNWVLNSSYDNLYL